MKGIAILGSTGSIGRQTLDVIRAAPNDFSVIGLSAWKNSNLLRKQVAEFSPQVVYSEDLSKQRHSQGFEKSKIVPLDEMVCHPDVDLVVIATSGTVSLIPTLKALNHGKHVALANKEAIVMAGSLISKEIASGGVILPVDSEPSAIWQCLRGEDQDVARLIITASGGALRKHSFEDLENVTPDEALNHPTWSMGRKITVDSATLMNKAFEVAEAHWLFNVPWNRIDVVLHHQSIVHSLVEFKDGSIKAQLSQPDMRLPLQYAMFYPKRVQNNMQNRLNISEVHALTFASLDLKRYPCYSLAMEAMQAGGTYPAALCGADEVAVELFLQGKIGFMDIPNLLRKVISEHKSGDPSSIEDIMNSDNWARDRILELAAR